MQKPSVPKGTRDFSAVEMQQRNYIFDAIKKHFRLYGFEQIETPAMENLETLTGKYGEEGDQLLFKILNSRIHESKNKEELKKEFELSLEKSRNTEILTERALRYDLTVPFARYVVMHQNEIAFPFKRFQVQPVWRADRPQKGRYREFFQCDADIIGSNSLLNEVELIKMMDDVYSSLAIPVTTKLNNRKVLSGIAEVINEPDKIVDITVAIDKLDKIGRGNVEKELSEKGVKAEAIKLLAPIFESKGSNSDKINTLKTFLNNSEIGKKGIEEIEFILSTSDQLELKSSTLELDITLARGLNYYTGSIIEVKANAGTLSSSITGGGRYDDLTGIFGLKGTSGVGISFGIDRIFDVMNELDLFSGKLSDAASVKVMFFNLDVALQSGTLKAIGLLRENGISAELYPDLVKEKKQFEYAQKKRTPFICTVVTENGATEYLLKNMHTREQQQVDLPTLVSKLKNVS
jgi:histidyl-tRNA synthetase